MKKTTNKAKGVVKGAPSGLVISMLVHAAAFLLAGMLVVFSVVQKEEKKFVPPKPVDRPKMKLKKPKVKVKKTAKPKATTRIVTKVKRASMPDIQLPEMSGMGEGLGGGMGDGFDILPDLDAVSSIYGGAITTGSDLKGFFYDFKRDRRGRDIPMSPDQLEDLIHKYMKRGWSQSVIAPYYRAPKPLYSSTVCIPTTLSEVAPWAFGEHDTIGYCWAVLYEGEVVYPEDITFRFWGVGDKFMAVNVDGETVLFCAYRSRTREYFSDVWDTKDPKDHTYYFAEARARPGDWITLKANEPQKIKIILGDLDGGLNYHIVSVEVKGEEYPYTRAGGGSTFPVFRTSEIPRDIMDGIYQNLYPGDASLTNGPIFRDFIGKPKDPPLAKEEPPPPTLKDLEGRMRTWTSVDGDVFEARFRTMLGRNTVVLENEKKKQVKFPFDKLMPKDREHIELITPPDFDINWVKASDQIPNPMPSPYTGARPMQQYDFNFGTRIKQTSASIVYDHDLVVEYFAIGEEVEGNNNILLDRNRAVFRPSEYRNKSFELRGDEVRLTKIAYRDTCPVRGTKYGGFLVTLTDKEGDIIAYKASHEYLFENLEKLRSLPVKSYFNRSVDRVFPTQPTEDNRGFGAIDGSG